MGKLEVKRILIPTDFSDTANLALQHAALMAKILDSEITLLHVVSTFSFRVNLPEVDLDEAQNATPLQLKMFLTRLGPSAKCIITGDLSQIDLPGHQKSGLRQAMEILDGVDGIAVINLTAEDVVRHRLVKEIIKAYDKIEAEERLRRERRKQQQAEVENARTETQRPDSESANSALPS